MGWPNIRPNKKSPIKMLVALSLKSPAVRRSEEGVEKQVKGKPGSSEKMASSGATGSSPSGGSPAPKILLAKPGIASAGPSAGKFIRGGCGGGGSGGGGAEDDSASIRSRLPPVGSLNLLSDSWEFHIDRFLPFLTDNTDFTVVGVVGPPSVGKSTIMNEIYGFDPISPGMLPPFALQTEESRANARHCTVGIEPRVTGERIILLDTQPIFSPSILAEITRPDGSSTIPIFTGENMSAELAHEIMGIRLGVLLASVCHVLLVVSEGVHDSRMWNLMSTVDLLKHGIPDPSSVTTSSNPGSEKEIKDKSQEYGEEYMASPVFVHTKLQDEDLAPWNLEFMKKVLGRYFSSSSFLQERYRSMSRQPLSFLKSCDSLSDDVESMPLSLFVLPLKCKDDSSKDLYGSFDVTLSNLRNQVLSMKRPAFSRAVSERDWLKNTAKIWELVKTSSTVAEYCKMLQNSGLFRR